MVIVYRLDEKLQSNTTKYEDWQTKADDLDKWLVVTTTELKTIEEPTLDPVEREKQKKYLEVSNFIVTFTLYIFPAFLKHNNSWKKITRNTYLM